MNKVLPGLYLGSIKDSKDKTQLETNKITHILAIHDHAKNEKIPIENIKYLRYKAKDNAQENIKQFFKDAIDFIHEARINNGNVLVHCLAGVSRSASLCIAYIITITEMPWYDALNAVRGAREQANPNFGFQRQLQNFEHTSVNIVREDLFVKYGDYEKTEDLNYCMNNLNEYKEIQARIDSNIKQNAHSFKQEKTYPLPFNAYKLDEEKKLRNSKKPIQNEKLNSDADPKNKEVTLEEREEIVQKIFG